MTTKTRTLLVNEIVTFRQEVSDESTFNEGQAFSKSLAGFDQDTTGKKNTLTCFRILEMLHQAQIVQLPLYTTTNTVSLADIEGLKLFSPPPTENVDPGVSWKPIQRNTID